MVLVLGLVACGTPAPAPTPEPAPAETPEATPEPEDEPEPEEARELNLVLSFHDPTAPWAQPMGSAAADFAAEFGVNTQFIGPTPPDAVRQLEQLITLVEQGLVDGVAVAPLEDATLRPFMDEMMEMGIPVVTFVTDSPESDRMAFYGQSFESLETIAYETARQTIALLGPDPQGPVAILNCLPDLESLIMRENGIKRALENYPGLELLGTFSTRTGFAETYADIEALMTAHPDIVALFAVDSFNTPSAARVLRDLGVKDSVVLSGYDMTEDALLLVRDGYLDILVGQNPYAMAYLALMGLYEWIMHGVTPVTIETEAEFATPANIAEFLRMYNVE